MKGTVGKQNRGASFMSLSGVVLFFFLFNALFTLFRWFPEYEFITILAPGVETVVLFVGIGYSLRLSGRWRAAFRLLLAGLSAVLAIYSFSETLTQYAFQEHFKPWTDLAFIAPLIDMVFQVEVKGRLFVLFVGGVLVVGLLTMLMLVLIVITSSALSASERLRVRRFLGHKTEDDAQRKRLHIRAGWIVLLLYLIPTGILFGIHPTLTGIIIMNSRPPAHVVLSSERQQGAVPAEESATNPESAAWNGNETSGTTDVSGDPDIKGEGTSSMAAPQATFPLLNDGNIFLFVVESYGQTLLSRNDHRALIMPTYRAIAAAFDRHEYSVVSALVSSPITGGRSWLADATMLTGVWIDTQEKYDHIITTGLKHVIHTLNHAEYRTILSAPGTSTAPPEWRRFYAFDEYYFHGDFGYQGPPFCFGDMPDQYQLNWLRKGPLEGRETKKTFLMCMLATSHTPFNLVPAYLEDWDMIGDGSSYHTLDTMTFRNNWITGNEYPEGYTASIRYVLTVISDFLVNFIQEEALIIIIGDHQPRFPVREKDSTTSVICHLVSKNPLHLAPFTEYGFSKGVVPVDEPPHMRMDAFAPMLLEVIARSRN